MEPVSNGGGESMSLEQVNVTHSLLIERAARWLEREAVAVITDMTYACSTETADVIGWDARGYSSLIEVKVSRSDFLADKHKPHRKEPGRGMGSARWYCAPKGLLKPEDMPHGWGLLEWTGKKIRVVHRPEVPPHVFQWDQQGQRCEIGLLISALRRIAQTTPPGVSVKAYTFESKRRATLGVAKAPTTL